ncbi:MAG: dihydrodipicolinate synthase family protein [Armatimonadetes bacterium]|nr:dihydrodipicolinate synthase family protein [Armatimonadota bacterium]
MSEHKPYDFLTGVIAPFWTPVDAAGQLDLNGVRGMVDYLANTRAVRSVFGRSGMGKWYTFTVEETKRLTDVLVPACRKQGMGVLIGAMGEYLGKERGERPDPVRYTEQSIELVHYAQKAGADAAVLVVPDMLPAEREAPAEVVWRYYRAVHDATRFPLVLYQPGGTHADYQLTPELMRRLLTLPRIAGLKLSTNKEEMFAPIAEVVRGTGFALIAGDEAFYLRALELGACGVIGGGCMIWPEVLWAVRHYYLRGEMAKARAAQQTVWQLEALHEGKDACVLWKQVMISQGAQFPPYDRSGTPPYPREVVVKALQAWRRLTAPYRRICHTQCPQKKGEVSATL